MHLLHLVDPQDNELRVVRYDPHTSMLTDAAGFDILGDGIHNMNQLHPLYWESTMPYTPISATNAGRKISAPKRLKIQLGLGCNKDCPYCLQALQVQLATPSSIDQARKFGENLSSWVTQPELCEKIEMWGGEPLLYWKHIQALMPFLKDFFPNASFGMITNGELLTHEITDQLKAWDFAVSMSHDGPGQFVRGSDPLDNWDLVEEIQYAFETLHPKWSFNGVLTPQNYNMEEIVQWWQERFPGANTIFEGVVHDYNGSPDSSFTPEQLNDLTQTLARQLIDGTVLSSSNVRTKLKTAIETIVKKRPSSVVGQKCGMDRTDQLAVDLKGWITTCQNVGAQGEQHDAKTNHRVGHVSAIKSARLTSSEHWSQRRECPTCPVLQLCQGACMYQKGDRWKNSCDAEYAYNMAFFIAALHIVTGRYLVGIDGPIVRPLSEKEMALESA